MDVPLTVEPMSKIHYQTVKIPTFIPQPGEGDVETPKSLRYRVANWLTGGEITKAVEFRKQVENTYDTLRPGIPTMDFVPQYVSRGWLGLPYFYESEVSIFSDIIAKLDNEVLRNRLSWNPKYVGKCDDCDKEYENDTEECDKCGGHVSAPDPHELDWLVRRDGTNFMDLANYNGQSFYDVTKTFLFHMNVSDNPYMLCIFSYVFHGKELKYKLPKEFIALDSRDVVIMYDMYGQKGKKGRICLEHRDSIHLYESYQTNGIFDEEKYPQECPECGKPLYEAAYQTITPQGPSRYYTSDEIYHKPYYYPSQLYGTPIALKMNDDLMAYHHIEKRTRAFYETARAPGIMFLPMTNQEALRANWMGLVEQIKQDPYTIPVMGTSETAPTQANFIKLLEDPNPNLIAVKNELRERLCSRYSISINMTNDTQQPPGNGPGQITESDKAVEGIQKYLKEGLFVWFRKCFGMKAHELICNPHIGDNEMGDEQLLSLKIQNARGMMEMGFDVKYTDHDFEYSGEPMNLAALNGAQQPGDMNAMVEQQLAGMMGQSENTINGQADNPMDGTAPERILEPTEGVASPESLEGTGQNKTGRTLKDIFG